MVSEFITRFLRQSNAIESVYDEDALDDAQTAWEFLGDQNELTHDVIKQTHELLLENRQPKIAGKYRDVYVRVGNDTPPSPSAVHPFMESLIGVNPTTAVEALQWHIKFEKIHPFTDGNGRIGRLLYLYHCTQTLGSKPILFTEENSSAYYSLFQTTPSNPDQIQISE